MATTSLPQNCFIVYILRRPDVQDPYDPILPAPFYVGKGKPKRAYFHFWDAHNTKQNTRKLNIIRAVERNGGAVIVDIVASDVSEPVAFMIERQLIHFYGRDDQHGLLANRTDGGEGPTGMALEARERIGASKRGIPRSPETVEKMRKGHTGFRHSEATKIKLGQLGLGRKHSPETRAKMSIAIQKAIARGRKPVDWTPERRARVSAWSTGRKYPEMGLRNRGGGNPVARGFWVEDQYYGSLKEAAEALGIDKTTIYRRLQRGDARYRYEPGTEDIGAKLSGSQSATARSVRVNGVNYATVDEAILQLGIGKTSFYRGIRKGIYKVESQDGTPTKPHQPKQSLCVNGVFYASVGEAIESLGIGETTFYRRVKAGLYVIEHPA